MPGPAPKAGVKHSQRGRLNYSNEYLPAEGRKGVTPKWPLSGRAPKGWAELWKKPQAVMWERQESEHAVARYLRLRNAVDAVESVEAIKPAFLSELRQLEASLGLSPKGMQNLHWEIASSESVQGGNFGNVINFQERAGSHDSPRVAGVKERLKMKGL